MNQNETKFWKFWNFLKITGNISFFISIGSEQYKKIRWNESSTSLSDEIIKNAEQFQAHFESTRWRSQPCLAGFLLTWFRWLSKSWCLVTSVTRWCSHQKSCQWAYFTPIGLVSRWNLKSRWRFLWKTRNGRWSFQPLASSSWRWRISLKSSTRLTRSSPCWRMSTLKLIVINNRWRHSCLLNYSSCRLDDLLLFVNSQHAVVDVARLCRQIKIGSEFVSNRRFIIKLTFSPHDFCFHFHFLLHRGWMKSEPLISMRNHALAQLYTEN